MSKSVLVVLVLCCVALSECQSLKDLFTTRQYGSGTYYGSQTGQYGACAIYPKASFMNGVRTVAMNKVQYSGGDISMTCGMCIELTGTGKGSGNNPIVGTFLVVVDDMCPGCSKGDLDLAVNGDGRWDINWVAVDCPVQGNLQYSFQGSNPWFLKMEVRNHRIPVKAVEFEKGGKWYPGKRTIDNHFEATGYPFPATFPLTIRVQGLDDKWVTDRVPSLSANVMNGLLGVQLGSIKESRAVAASDSTYQEDQATNSAENANVLIIVLVGAALLILFVIVVAVVVINRKKQYQVAIESKP